jgi:hypothetical protein
MKGRVVLLLLCFTLGMSVSVSTAQPALQTITAENDALSVSATPVRPQMLFEIALVIQNKTTKRVHVDPSLFALVTDQGEQTRVLTTEQAKSLVNNPGQSAWSYFWFGDLGYAANKSAQDDERKKIDEKNLTAIDIFPNAIVRGSVFFKNPDPKTRQVTLYMDGMTLESGEKIPILQVVCEIPLGNQGATTTPGQAPTKAVVTSTIQRTALQATVALQIVVPGGDPRQSVKVVAIGSDGSPRTVYEGFHAPGETVATQAVGVAPLFVQVYVAGVMVKQITVPTEGP